jgi:PHD/YefM family antitoxin component YafN of YafNO toxin-antitoxin module
MQAESSMRRPLSELPTHTAEWVEELSKTEQPLILTVDEEAAVVMQNAATYKRMVDRLEELETTQAIQEGLRDVEAGRTVPLDEAMEQLRQEFGLHR